MARSRLLKPAFFQNEDLATLSAQTRLCYAGLWGLADREGRLEDRPQRIRVQLFPYEAVDVDWMLAELARAGFIQRYVVHGQRFIWIQTFLKHQKPHMREASSEIPGPEQADEHQPRPVLGSDEHQPRQPVSETVTVSKTVTETGSIPVSVSDPKTETVSQSGHRTALTTIARQAFEHLSPNHTFEEFKDHLLHYSNGAKLRKLTKEEVQEAYRLGLRRESRKSGSAGTGT